MIQKIKKIIAEAQRRREKYFVIVNRATGAVNNKLAFPLCLCVSVSLRLCGSVF
jgi:hypothetical protein